MPQASTSNPEDVERLTETIINTIVVIDYDTYEERISYKTTELQYRIDTVLVFNFDIKKEVKKVVESYRDIPDYKKKEKR